MDLHTFLITIIAFSAVISVLSFAFSLMLNPVKENQARMEKNQARMEKDINTLKEDVSTIKQTLLKISNKLS